jgi:uncharacterized membrane-anchored protein YitT (DUF2179 family)
MDKYVVLSMKSFFTESHSSLFKHLKSYYFILKEPKVLITIIPSYLVKELSRYGVLLAASMLQGVAMAIFLFPHHIPSGGNAGLAILLNHWFHLSLGFALWSVNFIFLTVAIYFFGIAWTVRTMFAVTITSITVMSFKTVHPIAVGHPLIDMVIGGILFGLGVGLLVKHGASSGGMLIPALMISTSRGLAPGRTMFWINISIFSLTAFIMDWQIIIYAVICQWISTYVIDLNNT